MYGEKRSIRVAVALLLCCVRNPLNSQGRSHNTTLVDCGRSHNTSATSALVPQHNTHALVPQHTSATTAGPTTMRGNAQHSAAEKHKAREKSAASLFKHNFPLTLLLGFLLLQIFNHDQKLQARGPIFRSLIGFKPIWVKASLHFLRPVRFDYQCQGDTNG